MDEGRLTRALAGVVGETLAGELASDFIKIRLDLATKSLERASPGKFVETFVQCMQQLARGSHDARPDVDKFLNKELENELSLPDGLRVCGGRVARAIYTMRSKRNIVHKGDIDPNLIDLAYIHQGAVWIVAEMIRCATGMSMDEAGALVEMVHAPVGTLVEEIDGGRIVLVNVSLRVELLILLHSHHPERVPQETLVLAVFNSSAASVRSRLSELRAGRMVVGDSKSGFRLTSKGYASAVEEIRRLRS